jgi:hypothetical protein
MIAISTSGSPLTEEPTSARTNGQEAVPILPGFFKTLNVETEKMQSAGSGTSVEVRMMILIKLQKNRR